MHIEMNLLLLSRGSAPDPAKGLSVRNIKCVAFPAPTSPPCHFVTFPLSVNGEGEIKVAFDLLSVPSIRTVHRTVLISAPLDPAIFFVFSYRFRKPARNGVPPPFRTIA